MVMVFFEPEKLKCTKEGQVDLAFRLSLEKKYINEYPNVAHLKQSLKKYFHFYITAPLTSH